MPAPRVALVAALALLVAGCGAGGGGAGTVRTTATTSATPTVETLADIDGCITPDDATLLVHKGEATVDHVALMGGGTVGVVISYGYGRTVCPWLPLAERLVESGYRVLLHHAVSGTGVDHVVEMATLIRAEGVQRVVLVGGDQNAAASIQAAADLGPAVEAVVSFSSPDATAAAARLSAPLLQLVSAEDTPFPALAQANDAAATGSPSSEVLVFPGRAHDSGLFDPGHPSAEVVLSAVLAFVAASTS